MLNKVRFFSFSVGFLISRVFASDDVTVYVWQQQGGNVGHVSLETQNSYTYISLWPETPIDPSQGILHAPAVSHTNYTTDTEAEGCEAQNKYLLKLDVNAIKLFWETLLKDAEKLSDGKIKLSNVTWFAPSGTDIASPTPNQLNLNCASTVLLALRAGGLDISPFERQLSQEPRRPSSEVGVSIAQALSNTTNTETFVARSNLACTYFFHTIKPQEVSDYLQKYIYDQIGTKINTIIMESLVVADDSKITKQDVINYIKEQLSSLDPLDRMKVRSTAWIRKNYLIKFLDITPSADPQVVKYALKASTKQLIESKVERIQRNRNIAAGAGIGALLAYFLASDKEHHMLSLLAGTALGALAGNEISKLNEVRL